jgi:transposase
VARIALEHGLNDNLVRRWIKATSSAIVPEQSPFVPLALPAPPTTALSTVTDDVIRIEVPRAEGAVTITWPASQADRAVSLLRELLL